MSTPITTLMLYRTELVDDNVVFDHATFLDYLGMCVNYPVTNCTFQRQNREMRLPLSMDVAGRYNYGSFVNNGRTYYCFITDMEYVNDNMTKASYKIDYWHTYSSDIGFRKTFIERRTIPASDDIICKYVQDEPVSVNKWVIAQEQTTLPTSSSSAWVYVMLDNGTQQQVSITPKTYGNHDYAANVIISSDISEVVNRLNDMVSQNDNANSLQGVWAVPYPSDSQIVSSLAPSRWPKVINMSETIGAYTVKNKKCLCSPYCYVGMMSSDGATQDLDIQDIIDGTNMNIEFDVTLSVIPSPQQVVAPKKMFGVDNTSKWASITCDNFPKPNLGTNINTVSNVLGLIGGGLGALGSAVGGVANTIVAGGGGASVAAGAYALANLGQSVVNTVDKAKHLKAIAGTKGSTASAMWSDNIVGISIALFVPDREELIAIDNFFSRYGYAINEIQPVTLHTRNNWDYIKTRDASFAVPDAEVDAERTINQMFNSGITIWHNADNFKDYSVANE